MLFIRKNYFSVKTKFIKKAKKTKTKQNKIKIQVNNLVGHKFQID